jgi:polysaccharide biosynthesis protein PslH
MPSLAKELAQEPARAPAPAARILFVTSVYPHAREYGAQQRVLNLCRLLGRRGQVAIVLLAAAPVDGASLERTLAEFGDVTVVTPEAAPLGSWAERLRFELDPDFLNASYFRISETDRRRVLAKSEASDLTWVHTIRTANECGIYRWPRSVLDLDDIPSHLNRTAARLHASPLRRVLSHRMALIWRRREGRVDKRFDLVTVCSEADRAYLGRGRPACVVPNGFPAPSSKPARAVVSPPRLGFIGWFQGRPNVEGVSWFIREVWPLVKARVPLARLRLVGGDTDRDFSADGADVDGLGYLDDPAAEISTWHAMIVPIRVGGGTRVKVAQAFSRNCPVVSTPLGVYGYAVRSGTELLVADDAEAFAGACVRLIEEPALAARIAENAWQKFIHHWTWQAVQGSVDSALAELTRAAGGARPAPPRSPQLVATTAPGP